MKNSFYFSIILFFLINISFAQEKLSIAALTSEAKYFIDSLDVIKKVNIHEYSNEKNKIIMVAIDRISHDTILIGISELICDYELDFAKPQFYILQKNNLILLRIGDQRINDLFEKDSEFIYITKENIVSIKNQLVNTSVVTVKKADINMVSTLKKNKIVSREWFMTTGLFPQKYHKVNRFEY